MIRYYKCDYIYQVIRAAWYQHQICHSFIINILTIAPIEHQLTQTFAWIDKNNHIQLLVDHTMYMEDT